uniref:exopolygalacturonase-like n=1 Tax=Fragaria vesca subsp. vesca TaxID=101020 RepID=UPI0005C86CDA|nr:PREDICTED: exopolygalacturonase-like [Fragaria vesca subsp. vesca]
MSLISSFLGFRVFLFMFLLVWVTNGQNVNLFRQTEQLGRRKFFNVMDYGAVEGGVTDNSQAFLKAWKDACQWKGRAKVLIPRGIFKLFPVVFSGPCNGPIAFLIMGTLRASTDPSTFNSENWINFRYLEQLTLAGGGTLDGQGSLVWPHNNCNNGPCRALPISLSFYFVTNATVAHLRSYNSKMAHIKVYGCNKMDFTKLRLSAPGDSPNTDGIKIGNSYRIRISRSVISTGDDCIAILAGSREIHISKIFCGPGHGISIGSLGGYGNENDVEGVYVKDSGLKGTTNGLRIKTWAKSHPLKVSKIIYDNIVMTDVMNPIIIDQNYCPNPPCNQQVTSNVQISGVTYNNIRGTSSSKEAVILKCSRTSPCKNIVMNNIKLSLNGTGGFASSYCENAVGVSYGTQNPRPCI